MKDEIQLARAWFVVAFWCFAAASGVLALAFVLTLGFGLYGLLSILCGMAAALCRPRKERV